MLASIGSTDSNLYFTLLGDSQALVASGVSVIDFNDLLSFELLKADGIPAVTSVPTSEDLPDASSPFSLNFNRTYGEDIKGRFYNGPFGRGWSDNYDATVGLTNSGNDVSVFVDGTTESFVKAANGNFYATTPGDTNSLSLVNNRYQLSDKAGDVTTFASDGTLASISDAHGNTITASRNASGQISTLLDSSGKSLTFAYNANGHVSMITSSSGQTAVYGYDSTGQYLTSVTSPRGTTQYGYSVPTAGPTAYEITSITSPGGAQIQYVYDGQGRVVKQQGINGSVPLTYSYGAASYTVTDALGNATTFNYNLGGHVTGVDDPLGRTATQDVQTDGTVTKTTMGGISSTSTYVAGNLTQSVDPLGENQNYTYDPASNDLTKWRNALGNTTVYSYTNHQVASITYADGSHETARYDAKGDITTSIDRAGKTTTFTYDASGNLLQRVTPDETDTYTYDGDGNILTATNASGTITMVYNAADELVKVTEPNGQIIQYSYNADGLRSQLIEPGLTENFTYNTLNKLISVTDGSGETLAGYTYDTAGKLSRQDNGNGTYTVYGYDPSGDLISLVNFASSGAITSKFNYTYNALGLCLTEATLTGTTTYGYDAAGRLNSVLLPNGRQITYKYDAEGNRTLVIDSASSTIAYTVNSLNAYTNIGGSTQQYNADGDMITESVPGATAATYTYDASGRIEDHIRLCRRMELHLRRPRRPNHHHLQWHHRQLPCRSDQPWAGHRAVL